MSFIADKQTLGDLNIPGKFMTGSIFSLFNRVRTGGGEKVLEGMFNSPLSDAEEINKRADVFSFFQKKPGSFPFGRSPLEQVTGYLEGYSGKSLLATAFGHLRNLVLEYVVRDGKYGVVQDGVRSTKVFLDECRGFFGGLAQDGENPFLERILAVRKVVEDGRLGWVGSPGFPGSLGSPGRLPFTRLIRYDHLLRQTLRKELGMLLSLLYDLDVSVAVGEVAAARGFHFAYALPKERNRLRVEGLYHPSLADAVGNTLSFSQESNMIFLTGANMAGKSTLMKSFGIAMYLAHMGFPVAAERMEFSVKDGIYSSINVPDNLALGYSHFYSEVLRVKKVAEEVSAPKDMIVIFDELFKGTNVKDAYDATLAVTEAFSAYRNCFFMISTHIIEVGEVLRGMCGNIRFAYLATVMEGTTPRYTYRLADGITADRQGMIIIENEGILELLK